MPINKITPSRRAKAAIAATLAALAAGAVYIVPGTKTEMPAAVVMAVDHLIIPWEGLVLTAHWDQFAKIYDICYGATRINGRPVTAGMSFTKAQCRTILLDQVYNDYWLPLTKGAPEMLRAPDSVQSSMLSGAYNFGVGSKSPRRGQLGSTAMTFHIPRGQWRAACEAQTAWNKAGGQIVNGLVKRREMGDVQRIGEAEFCVSGL